MTETHPTLPDPRNESLLVHVDGELVPREEAKVSVFDSVVQGGDAVWEGIRVYDGKVFALEPHLDRLRRSARAMAFDEIPSQGELREALFATLEANGMRDEAHVRLTLTRGKKVTSNMDPAVNRSGPTLIVLAEWKPPRFADAGGLSLVTASVRRNPPDSLDSKIHHANLINNVLAKIEANVAGADEAVMLDPEGYVAETNATNLFFVRDGEVRTPRADFCLPGITRGIVLDLCRDHGIPVDEKRISPAEMYAADECFTTGTVGELVPALEIDGRTIGDGTEGPVTGRLRELYRDLTGRAGEPLPF